MSLSGLLPGNARTFPLNEREWQHKDEGKRLAFDAIPGDLNITADFLQILPHGRQTYTTA